MKKLLILPLLLALFSCDKEDTTTDNSNKSEPQLTFTLKLDASGQRLDNFGNPSTIPAGNAAQSPNFHLLGMHYIELSDADDVLPYQGEELYNSPLTQNAIDFDSALYAKDGEEFFSVDISKLKPGTYKYVRISVSYQNYDVDFRANGYDLTGRLASFVGANNYIESYEVNTQTVNVNGTKKQGYWAFETNLLGTSYLSEGQAPGTTVPNPLSATSPIAPGSCLVTGVLDEPLVITGNETEDIKLNIAFSINNSFEWKDDNGNGIYEPMDGDTVVDMGLRGMHPSLM